MRASRPFGMDWRLTQAGMAVGRIEVPDEAKRPGRRWGIVLWSPAGRQRQIPVESDGSFRTRLAPGYYGMSLRFGDVSGCMSEEFTVSGGAWGESASWVVRVWGHDAAPPAATEELRLQVGVAENPAGFESNERVASADARVVRGQNLRSRVVNGRLPPKVAATVFVAGAVAVPIVYVSSRHDVAISSSP